MAESVRDVTDDWFDGEMGPYDLLAALGIDLDMPVETLRKHLLYGKRADALHIFPVDEWSDDKWDLLSAIWAPDAPTSPVSQ